MHHISHYLSPLAERLGVALVEKDRVCVLPSAERVERRQCSDDNHVQMATPRLLVELSTYPPRGPTRTPERVGMCVNS